MKVRLYNLENDLNPLKNLFIVKTPLQVINSIEAIEYFNLKDNIVIVIRNKNDKNSNQIDKVVDLYKWKEIITINTENDKTSYFKYLSIIKELKKHKYNYIFFARFGSIQRLIISNTIKNNLYYFDDGMETITMYNKFLTTNKINKLDSRQFARLRFALVGLKINIYDTINLFTYFDLKPFGNSKVALNKLEYFRSKYIEHSKIDENIYILGQPLFERGLLDENKYIEYIQNIINKYDKPITYIPHKGEALNSKINLLVNNNFKIKNLELPIELYFLENNIQPAHIISFFTTAFFTLKLFYPKALFQAIYIPEKFLLKKQSEIQAHYDFISNLSIEYI